MNCPWYLEHLIFIHIKNNILYIKCFFKSSTFNDALLTKTTGTRSVLFTWQLIICWLRFVDKCVGGSYLHESHTIYMKVESPGAVRTGFHEMWWLTVLDISCLQKWNKCIFSFFGNMGYKLYFNLYGYGFYFLLQINICWYGKY